MYKISKEIVWDMAHRLPNHKGLCFNVHGHTYKAIFTLESNEIRDDDINEPQSSMVMDFKGFKVVKEWIDKYRDHAYVGKKDDKVLQYLKKEGFRVYELDRSPTAEYMSKFLYRIFKEVLSNLKSVTIYETPTSFSTYTK